MDKFQRNSREILSDFLNKVYFHKLGDTNFEFPIDYDNSNCDYSNNSSFMMLEKKKESYLKQMEDYSMI